MADRNEWGYPLQENYSLARIGADVSEAPTLRGATMSAQVNHRPEAQRELSIVFIDDDFNLRRSATDLLAEYGIHVIGFAAQGCLTLKTLSAAEDLYGPVDALILDERLPHMRGLEATRLVRRFYPDLPVILYTAFAHMLGDEPTQAGVTSQVSKADHPLTLIRAIRSACDPNPATVLA